MINVFGSSITTAEKDAVNQTLDTGWMGIGPKVSQFETAFKNRMGLDEFAMLDSGSNALYMAVKLLDLPMGSEIVIPSFTWVSCAQAVVLCGHKVVFADVDTDTQNITAEHLRNKITDKTGAIMVVHYAGLPCDMKAISELGIPIIEDAAHAVDSKIGDDYCGSFGDVAIYSFDAVKNLATPEGGGLTAKDPSLVNRAKKMRYCGIESSGFGNSTKKGRWWEYNIVEAFPKCLPNDVSATIGLVQLDRINELQNRRKQIWDAYQTELKDIGCELPVEASGEQQHSYFTYLIRLRNNKRDDLACYLKEKGIYTTLRYHPLHLNEIYRNNTSLPNCEELNRCGLNLPLHPNLTAENVDKVIECVKAFFREN